MGVIVDTGAYSNYIKKEAAKILQLNSIGKDSYHNPLAGKVDTDIYKVNIRFDQGEFQNIEVQDLIQDTYPSDFILGVAFLKFSSFIYDGKNRFFTIEFP